MNKMNNLMKMNDSPIKRKIILLALFSTLIPLLVLGPFTFVYLNNVVENKVSTTINNFLNIADWNLNTFVSDIEDISNVIFLSNDIQGYLTYNKVDPKLYRLETSSMNTLNNITVVNKPYINAIFIGNENHSFLKVNRGESNLHENSYPLIQQSNFYPRLRNSPWEGEWYNESDMNLVKGTVNSLLYGRLIRNLGTKEEVGVLLISIDQLIFESMFKEIDTPGEILILDGSKILYSSGNKQIRDPREVASSIEEPSYNGIVINYVDGIKYIFNYHTNEKTNWKIVSIIPYESVVKEVNQIRVVTITLLTLAFIISILIAVIISKKITRELGLLRIVTEKMEKREVVSCIQFNEDDEIGKIGNRFVELYNRNNDLTVKLYQSEVKEKEAELKALQSHINPHFLYNTLNSIYWMAEKSNAKTIAKMAISLSKIFKLTLNNGSAITTVKNEIDQVKSYLEIQNIRFDNKIDYFIDIQPEILEEKMIKLLLQPIVENSVYHGLENKNGKGTIIIKGVKRENCLFFEIRDTGEGFHTKDVDFNTSGYALKNINDRLKLFYGDEYGLQIESKRDKGTTVILKVGLTVEEEIQ